MQNATLGDMPVVSGKRGHFTWQGSAVRIERDFWSDALTRGAGEGVGW